MRFYIIPQDALVYITFDDSLKKTIKAIRDHEIIFLEDEIVTGNKDYTTFKNESEFISFHCKNEDMRVVEIS